MNQARTRLSSKPWPGAFLLSLLVAWWVPSLAAAYRVTDLALSSTAGGTRVAIETDAPAQYSSFTIDDTEPRLVIDLAQAVHALDAFRYQPSFTGFLTGVRTSQYRPHPDPVVRIVMDLSRLVPYEITSGEHGLVIVLQNPASEISVAQVPREDETILPELESEPVPEKSTVASGTQQGQDQTSDSADTAPPAESGHVPMADPDHQVLLTRRESPSPPAQAPVVDSMAAEPSAAPAENGDPPPSLLSRLTALGIREPVSYSSGGHRDPFVPLPSGQQVEFGQAPLPDVEKLSIVGILQGVDGYRALAQDESDNGYVLRKGDRVLYGYVARIEAERVVFHLNRRGLDRTVILKLP